MNEYLITKELQEVKKRIGYLENSDVGSLTSSTPDEDEFNDNRQDDYELAEGSSEPETVSLATFNLENGNTIQFLGIPELDEIMVGEISDIGEEEFLSDLLVSPAEIFRILAPDNSPVPRMLASVFPEGRKVVDAIEDPINVSLEKIGSQIPTSAVRAIGSCQSGTFFKNKHCNTLGGKGYGVSESSCYSGAYKWVENFSNSRMRATYTRMACCGSGRCRLRHSYGIVGGFHTQLDIYVNSQKVVTYWSYKKGIRRYRKVKFEALESGGSIRGWIKYHREVTA